MNALFFWLLWVFLHDGATETGFGCLKSQYIHWRDGIEGRGGENVLPWSTGLGISDGAAVMVVVLIVMGDISFRGGGFG